jgi:hypothetical protein
MSKLSKEEISRRLGGTGIKILSQYVDANTKSKFLCFCGNEFETTPVKVYTGHTKSCGCKKLLAGNKSSYWKGYGEISGACFYRIKICSQREKLKSYEFNVTIEYLWDLFLKQNRRCAISGVMIDFRSHERNGLEQTASLDRIDSSQGYVIGNVQWVHKKVNELKSDNKEQDFLGWVQKIYEFKIREKNNG